MENVAKGTEMYTIITFSGRSVGKGGMLESSMIATDPGKINAEEA